MRIHKSQVPAAAFRRLAIAALLSLGWAGGTVLGHAQMNWPQLSFNNAHLGFNPSETTLSVSNVGSLRQVWTFSTQGSLSLPAVVDETLYIGSGDGHVYAVNANTGALIWKALLAGGGTSASPIVANGIVYIGTGSTRAPFMLSALQTEN